MSKDIALFREFLGDEGALRHHLAHHLYPIPLASIRDDIVVLFKDYWAGVIDADELTVQLDILCGEWGDIMSIFGEFF